MDDHCVEQLAESPAVGLAESPAVASIEATSSSSSMIPLAIAGACAYMNLFATQPLLPMLAHTFNASKFAVSLTVTAPPIAIALAAPALGRLSDRWGRKRTMLWAAFLLSFSTILTGTSVSLAQIIAWRFLQGVFTPGVFSVTVAYINEEWDSSRVGHAMAVFGTGGIIGGCFGRTLAGIIAAHSHWRWTFILLGCINLIWTMALAKSLPRERRFVPSTQSASWFRLLLDHLNNRPLLATYLVGSCILFSMLGTFTYVNFHLAAPPFYMGTAALGYVFLVYLVGAVITPVAGRWIDRLGYRNAFVGATAVGVVGVLLTLANSLWIVVAGLAVFSSATFITQASANSHIGSVVEHSHALAAGLYASFYYVGGGAGSSVPAWMWEIGGWNGCVMLVALVQVIGAIIAWFFWSRNDQQNKS
jgi:MFS transporter, YNFM family, putative membrane transport protein